MISIIDQLVFRRLFAVLVLVSFMTAPPGNTLAAESSISFEYNWYIDKTHCVEREKKKFGARDDAVRVSDRGTLIMRFPDKEFSVVSLCGLTNVYVTAFLVGPSPESPGVRVSYWPPKSTNLCAKVGRDVLTNQDASVEASIFEPSVNTYIISANGLSEGKSSAIICDPEQILVITTARSDPEADRLGWKIENALNDKLESAQW